MVDGARGSSVINLAVRRIVADFTSADWGIEDTGDKFQVLLVPRQGGEAEGKTGGGKTEGGQKEGAQKEDGQTEGGRKQEAAATEGQILLGLGLGCDSSSCSLLNHHLVVLYPDTVWAGQT